MKSHHRGIRSNCIAQVFCRLTMSVLHCFGNLSLKKASGDRQCLASVNLRVNYPQGRLGVYFQGTAITILCILQLLEGLHAPDFFKN